jgi:anti-sigma factor RsiW
MDALDKGPGECISPGAVASDDLIAYLDGNAPTSVIAHLRACPYCRAEARSLARTQLSFQSVLRRATCPSPLRIGDYALGLALPEQREQLAAHFNDCPRCAEELVAMRAFFADIQSH